MDKTRIIFISHKKRIKTIKMKKNNEKLIINLIFLDKIYSIKIQKI